MTLIYKTASCLQVLIELLTLLAVECIGRNCCSTKIRGRYRVGLECNPAVTSGHDIRQAASRHEVTRWNAFDPVDRGHIENAFFTNGDSG